MSNDFAPSSGYVIYQAVWQAVNFSSPIAPGSASSPQSTVAASGNTAYVVIAPGWDPTSSTPPTSFILLQSQGSGFAVSLNSTLNISVNDASFSGDCAGGSTLTQTQADFMTGIVFGSVFTGLQYNAATCMTTSSGS